MNHFVRLVGPTTITLIGVLMGLTEVQVAQATPLPPLPGGAANVFAGKYTDGNGAWASGIGGNPGSPNLTDNNLDSQANSVYEGKGTANGGSAPAQDVNAAVFPTPVGNPATTLGGLGTFGPITDIRIWGQPAFPIDGGADANFTNSYVVPPTEVGLKSNYTAGDATNFYTMNASNFSSSVTILAVNGNAPTFAPDGKVALPASAWQGPVVDATDNGHSPGAFYVDLTVSLHSTNGVFFDFGIQPDRSAALGGLFINEIQAFASPEPASCFLLAIATGMLGLLRLRRRNRRPAS